MKWITVQGQDREGKGLHYLIHGAHDLQEGERVLVFPSADRRIPYAAAKGLAIEPGTRVVAVPHTKMPWSRITTSIFANDALPPTANFEADATLGYQPFEVRFTDLSYANPPAIAWHWDFGDGGTSEEQHPTHIYQGLGWFTVTLTVTNGLGSDYLRKEALIFSDVDHPVDLVVWRAGDSASTISWIPGANNQQVVIARRHDFYPPHPNNAARVYYGAAGGGPITDSGLDPGEEYYYRIWGIREGILSEGYRSAEIEEVPITESWLVSVVDHDAQDPSSNNNCLGPASYGTETHLGPDGWIKAAFDPRIHFLIFDEVTIYEGTAQPPYLFSVDLNPNAYIYPNCYSWKPASQSETYDIGFIYPNILYFKNVGGTYLSGHLAGARARR